MDSQALIRYKAHGLIDQSHRPGTEDEEREAEREEGARAALRGASQNRSDEVARLPHGEWPDRPHKVTISISSAANGTKRQLAQT